MLDLVKREDLDEIDVKILRILQVDGRISHSALGEQINLSPSATRARVLRLESEGYIKQYVAILNPDLVGFSLFCFIHVSFLLRDPDDVDQIRKTIIAIPEVLECYHVTGQSDLILKVAMRSHQDISRTIQKLLPIRSISSTETSIAINQFKSTTELPL